VSGERAQTTGPVVEVALEQLRLWDRNPRWIAPASLENLKQTLTDDPEMLRARPLIVLPDGTVVCGNMRLRAAQELGWRSLPVVFADLDPERAAIWALRDNSSWGEWDDVALSDLLGDLAEAGVDLALVGFESREIDRLLAGFDEQPDPEEIAPLPVEPESRPGELVELGRHRLLCSDSTDADELARVLAGETAICLLTDFPWGVNYVGKTRDALRIANDSPDGLETFLRAALSAIDTVLAPGAPVYLFAPSGNAGTEFRLAIRDIGWRLEQELVWVKDNFVLGHACYHHRHEAILFGHKPGPGRSGRGRHRGSRWYGGNDRSTVLFCDRPKRSAEHPTSKPVELLCELLRNSTRHGDLVLDPFGGSGATLAACELLGRRCVTVELDPRYADVIRNRYRRLTGA
jgi:DNA modification methylase